jgi:nucleotide-binding universal stress UspA family protein
MAANTVIQCPLCELRFTHGTELAHHVATDHPAQQTEDIAPPRPWQGVVTVPLDPAHPPTDAVAVATALARQGGFAVEVVAAPAPGLPVTDRYLAARQRELVAAGVSTLPARQLSGAPVDALVAHATSGGTSLLCMATRGRGAVAERTLGSVTAEVVRRATVPVLLAGPGLRHAGTPIRRIAVGFDGSRLSRHALDAAVALADRIDAPIELFEVVDPHAPVLEIPETAMLRSVADAMATPPRAYDVLHDRHPARALVAQAGTAGDTLLVVGARGRTGIDRFVLGSVSHGLARRAAGPVLVVPRDAVIDFDHPDVRSGATGTQVNA